MTVEEYIALDCSKYVVVGLSLWEADDKLQLLSFSPSRFDIDGDVYTVISLEQNQVEETIQHFESNSVDVGFGFTGSNGASFLTHQQALDLISSVGE